MLKEIEQFWNINPPMNGVGEPYTLEWSNSIIEDRMKFAPYLKQFINWDDYRGKQVLELGCGAGSDTIKFAAAGADVLAYDITDKAVDLTKKRLQIHGLKGVVRKYDGLTIPLDIDGEGTIDLIYSCGVLHHTPHMENLLSDVQRLLKPGGKFKMMLYHRESLLYYYSILYRNIIAGSKDSREELLNKYSEFRENCPYTRCFTKNEITDILKRQGFEYYNIYTASVVYDDNNGRKLDGRKKFDVKDIGLYDVAAFFKRFNFCVKMGYDLDGFGWHLLVTVLT